MIRPYHTARSHTQDSSNNPHCCETLKPLFVSICDAVAGLYVPHDLSIKIFHQFVKKLVE
jgi:hypothetical protein